MPLADAARVAILAPMAGKRSAREASFGSALGFEAQLWAATDKICGHMDASEYERTDEHITFFGLEVELWRIGESPVAPKFNVVSKPNDWTRSVQQAAQGETSEYKQLQLKFWTAFKEYLEEKGSILRSQKPSPQSWLYHSLGMTGARLGSVASYWDTETDMKGPEIRVELYLDGRNAKQDFGSLEARKAEIEQALGFPLTWHNPEGTNTCRLYVRKQTNFQEENLWPEQFEWLRQNLGIMHKVLGPIVSELRSN